MSEQPAESSLNKTPDELELANKFSDYKQKYDEYMASAKEYAMNIDPRMQVTLRAQKENLYEDLKQLHKKIKQLCEKTSSEFRLDLPPEKYQDILPRCEHFKVTLVSLGIAGLVVVARLANILQPLELGFYDHLIQVRGDSKPSDKVLVIEVTDQDIAEQQDIADQIEKEQVETDSKDHIVIGSLSNKTLAEVLEKVDKLSPVAVGLDLYRDNIYPQDEILKRRFKSENSNLFTICKSPFTNAEVAPPPDANLNRVAFSDNVLDSDGVIRRYTLAYNAFNNPQATGQSTCTTNFSFALLLASQYLKASVHGIELVTKDNEQKIRSPLKNPENCLTFTDSENRNIIFPNFQRFMGGYQNVQHYTRCQILINYQRRVLVKYSPNNRSNAEVITLGEFLKDFGTDFPIEKYQDRVVLIGSVAYNTLRDYWITPYTSSSGKNTLAGESMPGVQIQAQVINQIINAALPNSGGRAMVWVLPQWRGIQWGEFLWIWSCSLTGGFLVWWWRFPPRATVISILAACVSEYFICYWFFKLSSGWFPFIPGFCALILTGGIVYWLTWRGYQPKSEAFSKVGEMNQQSEVDL